MGRHSVPDRWLNYKSVGSQINGTNFIAFKVPLHDETNISVNKNEKFSTEQLIERVPNLGLIIDLTNTNRYYNPNEFKEKGIEYTKIMVPGHEVPKTHIRKSFSTLVKKYLQDERNSTKLIGVHCTHGINRTGFLICYFMIQELNIDPYEAIKRFEIARGYQIERKNYINFLTSFKDSGIEEVIDKKPNIILFNSNIDDANLEKSYITNKYNNLNMFGNVSESNKDIYCKSSNQSNNLNWDINSHSYENRLKWNLNSNDINLEEKSSYSQIRPFTATIRSRSPSHNYRPNYNEGNSSEQKQSRFTTGSRSHPYTTSLSYKNNNYDNTNWREPRVSETYFQNNSAAAMTKTCSPPLNSHYSQQNDININITDHGSWREPRTKDTFFERNTVATKSPLYSHNTRKRNNSDHERSGNEVRSRDINFQNYEKNLHQNNNDILPYVHSKVNRYATSQQYLNTYDKSLFNHSSNNSNRKRNKFE